MNQIHVCELFNFGKIVLYTLKEINLVLVAFYIYNYFVKDLQLVWKNFDGVIHCFTFTRISLKKKVTFYNLLLPNEN